MFYLSRKQNVIFYAVCGKPADERSCADIYRRIRDLREDADLRQRDLAEYLNCTQVSYSHYELGKRDIPTDVLIRLADFYGTSTDYLLGLTDVPRPYPRGRGG